MTPVLNAETELRHLADSDGLRLPYPIGVIVGLERRGLYVDLRTGLIGSAEERVLLTVLGEAAVIVGRRFAAE